MSSNDLTEYIEQMDMNEIEAAANLIIEAGKSGNRLHVSGIGKPGHIAGYISSLISSTGTPTYFLHGTEAVHGSGGQLTEENVVIFISNSGKTAEMKSTVLAETLVLQTLSVYLQKYVDITPQEYVKRHPGGALGHLRKGE